ncbi:hypothetical protein BDD12DRAFT_316731 [Trichophaea hybrida]|nr:hypothetical protein BDD12DRAFT_316731 [Trichophaea hybrida]
MTVILYLPVVLALPLPCMSCRSSVSPPRQTGGTRNTLLREVSAVGVFGNPSFILSTTVAASGPPPQLSIKSGTCTAYLLAGITDDFPPNAKRRQRVRGNKFSAGYRCALHLTSNFESALFCSINI